MGSWAQDTCRNQSLSFILHAFTLLISKRGHLSPGEDAGPGGRISRVARRETALREGGGGRARVLPGEQARSQSHPASLACLPATQEAGKGSQKEREGQGERKSQT